MSPQKLCIALQDKSTLGAIFMRSLSCAIESHCTSIAVRIEVCLDFAGKEEGGSELLSSITMKVARPGSGLQLGK